MGKKGKKGKRGRVEESGLFLIGMTMRMSRELMANC